MIKTEFDFRDGLDVSKQVYKDKSLCNFTNFLIYIACWITSMSWMAAWCAISIQSWKTNGVASFWCFIGIFFASLFSYLGFFAIPNLVASYKREKERKRIKKEEKLALERILYGENEDPDTNSGNEKYKTNRQELDALNKI